MGADDELDQQRNALFPPETDDPPPHTFELGLVLGGTVSAGAYTAGALDLLLEALEAWHGSNPPPPHNVLVKTAGGSSGGAVCAAILGLLSGRALTHADRELTPASPAGPAANPLWDVWVEQFDLGRLLSVSDLVPPRDADAGSGAEDGSAASVQHVPSLLNCELIKQISGSVVRFAEQAALQRRTYFAQPFRTAITVTNMRGLPFRIDVPKYAGYTGAAYLQHDDFAWFAFPNGAAIAGKRPDEFWLDPVAKDGKDVVGFDVIADYATASGAMPVGLAALSLSRPRGHYSWRPYVRPCPLTVNPKGFQVIYPEPDWNELPDGGDYQFSAVDGGTLNNDPVRLVHRALAGLVGRNDQTPEKANRAMLMIDPLADQPLGVKQTGTSLISVAAGLVGTFVSGSRYLTADMDLFAKQEVFSRFQLVPTRPATGTRQGTMVGEQALAGTTLGALAGFASRAVRVHDYMLGRHNMRDYLASELVLRGNNPLFDRWTDGMIGNFATDDDGGRISPAPGAARNSYFLPVIPVAAEIRATLPTWPAGELSPRLFAPDIRARAKAVLDQLSTDNIHGALGWLVNGLAVPAIADYVRQAVVGVWTQQLTGTDLLKPGDR